MAKNERDYKAALRYLDLLVKPAIRYAGRLPPEEYDTIKYALEAQDEKDRVMKVMAEALEIDRLHKNALFKNERGKIYSFAVAMGWDENTLIHEFVETKKQQALAEFAKIEEEYYDSENEPDKST